VVCATRSCAAWPTASSLGYDHYDSALKFSTDFFSDYVCVPAVGGDGMTQSNIDEADAINLAQAEVRPIRPTALYSDPAPSYSQPPNTRYHDDTTANDMRTFHNMTPRWSASSIEADGYHSLQTGQTQLDHPSQEVNVQSWNREPLFERYSFQLTGLNQPPATRIGDIGVHNASNASFGCAAEDWPVTEQFGTNYGDSYEDFAVLGDYTSREFGPSMPSQGQHPKNDFEHPAVE
jgi:hypothetical protein